LPFWEVFMNEIVLCSPLHLAAFFHPAWCVRDSPMRCVNETWDVRSYFSVRSAERLAHNLFIQPPIDGHFSHFHLQLL
jgi:hypothetical protein